MDQMQDDQPEYWELAEEDDIEEWLDYYAEAGLPIPSALWVRKPADPRGPEVGDRAIQDFREDYCITEGLPLPSALWELMRVRGWPWMAMDGLEKARQKDKEDSKAFRYSFRYYYADRPVSYTHLTLPTNREV